MQVTAIKTRLFREAENLADFIQEHVPNLPEGAVLVVTSKIAALAEGRTAPVEEKLRLIQEESDWAHETALVWLTLKDGMFMANAGVDDSNGDGKLILLPGDSYKAAADLRIELLKRYGLKQLGILFTDSRTQMLRWGVTGVALGYAGFAGLRDYRQQKDLYGRPFRFEQTNVADCLATAAVLVMGEGDECTPLGLITDAPVDYCDTVDPKALSISPANDVFKPFFAILDEVE